MSKQLTLGGKYGSGNYALVDDEEYEFLCLFNWYGVRYGRGDYIRIVPETSFFGRHIQLPRFVMNVTNADSRLFVDHRNGDTLDNRKSNLRLCTQRQNNYNTRKLVKGNCTSMYKGVSWCSFTSRWRATIKGGGGWLAIGRFDLEEDAARAYDAKARELHGEFAWLNFPAHNENGRSVCA